MTRILPAESFEDIEVLEILPDTVTGTFLVRVWADRDDQARLLPPDSYATGSDVVETTRQALLRYRLADGAALL